MQRNNPAFMDMQNYELYQKVLKNTTRFFAPAVQYSPETRVRNIGNVAKEDRIPKLPQVDPIYRNAHLLAEQKGGASLVEYTVGALCARVCVVLSLVFVCLAAHCAPCFHLAPWRDPRGPFRRVHLAGDESCGGVQSAPL